MISAALRHLARSAAIASAVVARSFSQDPTAFFEQKIRPVLVAECYECHGAEKQKGGLRLDSREATRKGGETGPAVTPGDPANSLLLGAIKHLDPDLKMPSKAPKLDDAVIRDFEKWIAQGAPDPRDEPPKDSGGKPSWETLLAARRSWWSLQPVGRPEPPAVHDAEWSAHPVDRFLLAKMDEHQLAPAPDADPRTLIRRLNFALTGLPPTIEEVEAFVRDPAVERAVDRLLASPRFGEHWARHWMDLVRYADTHGSEGDPDIPEAWRYRDYLIRAFNGDVPLDQIIREHLAGDVLPNPRWNRDEQWNESMLGTVHLRLVEHGYQPVDTLDEQVKVVDNQIDVAMKAFQGLTVTCARCHDHKFDAISQRDYYALFGVFASCRPAMVTIDAPERLERNRAELAALKSKLKVALADAWLAETAQIPKRLLAAEARAADIERRVRAIAVVTRRVSEIESTVRRRILAERGVAAVENLPSPFARWSFEEDARDSLGGLHGHLEGGAELRGGRLVLNGRSAFARTDPLSRELREKTMEAWVSPANLTQSGGGIVSVQDTPGHIFDSIVFAERDPAQWMAGSDSFHRTLRLGAPAETARPEEFVHVAVAYHADGRIAVFRDGVEYGMPYRPMGERAGLQTFAPNAAQLLFGLRHTGAGNGFFAGEIEEARLYDRALSPEELAASFRAGAAMIGVSAEDIAKACAPAEREQLTALNAEIKRLRAESAVVLADPWGTAISDAEKDAANPLRAWVKLRALNGAEFSSGWAELSGASPPVGNPVPAWNLATGDYARCFHSGPGPGAAPAACGEFSIEPGGESVLGGLYPAGVLTHALSRNHGGVFTTPRFKVDSDFISVHACGGGGAQVRLIVDGYPLGNGGIFPRAHLEKDEPAWITIDVKYRRGSMAYLEFATAGDLTRPEKRPADGRSWFGVDRIVLHDAAGKPPADAPALRALLAGDPAASAETLAARYAERLGAAVAAWRDGALTEEPRALLDFFVRRGLLPVAVSELGNARSLVAEYRRLEAEVPGQRHAPGVLEGDSYDAPLFVRGEHTKPAEPIPRAFLTVFGGKPFSGAQSGRLELASAITDPANPLTARVMVNRVWHWLFGRGLVATPDNFGRMGEKPTHPELLDFLAAHCVEHGWSTKELVRFLVTTRAFRVSSDPSREARERDPGDDWLSHFRIRRLEAESIRDTMLAVSSRLDDTMFGPGVEARAPAGQQARRSIYFTIRRTNLSPFLEVFDAPKPFSTLGRRDSTNVPAQSLMLLNDPFVIELARRWAESAIATGRDETVEARVRRMFTMALARPPSAEETDASLAFLDALSAERPLTLEARFTDVRLWQDLAQSLFNLKEFVYLR